MSAIDVCASTRSTVQMGQNDTLRIVNEACKAQPSSMRRWSVSTIEETAQFDLLHNRLHDRDAVATAFDLLMVNGEDIRRKPFVERKSALHDAVCRLGLEGIASKRMDASYRPGPARSWLKIKNPDSAAATRAVDGTF